MDWMPSTSVRVVAMGVVSVGSSASAGDSKAVSATGRLYQASNPGKDFIEHPLLAREAGVNYPYCRCYASPTVTRISERVSGHRNWATTWRSRFPGKDPSFLEAGRRSTSAAAVHGVRANAHPW